MICRLRLAELALGLDSTRRAMPTARATDRSAHSAGPGFLCNGARAFCAMVRGRDGAMER